MGIEPMTSSLPRKRSTPELHRLTQSLERETRLELATPTLEGLCSTNWAIPAWLSGERRIRTSEVVRQQIYSLPQLATLVSPRYSMLMYVFVFSACHRKKSQSRWRDSNPRPADYKSAALTNWATSAYKELQWNTPSKIGSQMYEYFNYNTKKNVSFLERHKKSCRSSFFISFWPIFFWLFVFVLRAAFWGHRWRGLLLPQMFCIASWQTRFAPSPQA